MVLKQNKKKQTLKIQNIQNNYNQPAAIWQKVLKTKQKKML